MVLLSQTQPDIVLADSGPRGEGAHISDVLRAISIRLGTLEDGPPGYGYMAIGQAWEDWYFANMMPSSVIHHPGEVELDGIFMNPDGLEIRDDGTCVVHEVKFTTKSSRHNILESWLYMNQIMCYCHAYGAKEAVMHVMHVLGNYRDDRRPTVIVSRISFTDLQLEECWGMIKNNLHLLDKNGIQRMVK